MTVSSQDTVFSHVGNGVTTTFAFGCQVPNLTDLVVYLDNVEQTSGYTAAGIGSLTGGTVTFSVAPANGAAIRIERDIELERTTDYQQNGDFLSDVVNPDFDRLWMALQGQKSTLGRAIVVPASDTVSPNPLPAAASRANMLMGFDAVGQPVAVVPSAQSAAALQILLAGANGSSYVGFTAAGIGALLRTQQDKDREIISIRDYALGDGSDETSKVQAFLNACAGKKGIVNAGTYVVTNVTIPSNTVLVGEGSSVARFKRKAFAAGNLSVLEMSSKTGISISGIGIDGDKTNQTNACHLMGIFFSDDITITGCEFVNSKAVSGGFGAGIAIQDGTGQTTKRKIHISGNKFGNNDNVDIFVTRTWYVDIDGNYMKGSAGGVSVINFVFPPVAEVQNFITVRRNIIRDQAGNGVMFNGYVESGTSSANARFGPGVPPQRYCIIEDNIVAQCTGYGIAFQGSDSIIANNNAYLCGSVALGGGFLMNAQACVFQGNTSRDCYHYGADVGGSYSCNVVSNNFYGNCATYGASGTDLNVGGAFNMLIQGNVFEQVGSQQMVAINALGIESDGTAPFPLPAGQGSSKGLQVIGNKILLNGVASSIGVWVYGSQERVTVQNNHVRNAVGINQSFILEAVELITSGNVDESTYANGSPVQTVSSASALVLPDVGNVFMVNGSTGITSIQSYSGSQNAGKIRVCQATSHGSGYSRSNPPTVTFSGGGGTGLAATALISYNGELVGWNVTNKGSGYTSAPTPSITHNGGSGGNCVPLVGCANFEGREITLNFTGTLTVTSGSNLALNGNYSATPGKVLRLLGMFGSWYEMSRS